jgi:Methylamine utilisation protein MauE
VQLTIFSALPEFDLAIRCAMALVFLTAAIGKFRHWTELRGVIDNFRLLPRWSVPTAAAILPAFEAAVGMMLLFSSNAHWPPSAHWAEILAMALLMLFAVAMGINLARGRREIDCGCFQASLKQRISGWLVARNGLYVTLLAVAYYSPPDIPEPAMVLNGVLAGIGFFIAVQCLELLKSLRPSWAVSRRGAI